MRQWGSTVPALEGFLELAATHRVIPVARQLLAEDLTPTAVARTFGTGPGTFILESAEQGQWSRWSFVGISSRATLLSYGGAAHWEGDVPSGLPLSGEAVAVLRESLSLLPGAKIDGFPPLTGGFVGALSWEIVRSWERLENTTSPDRPVPELALILVGDMVALDHHTGTVWLIANAINHDGGPTGAAEAHQDACRRLDEMENKLARARPVATKRRITDGPEPSISFTVDQGRFEEMVAAGKEAIAAGDVFQIVLSLRADVATSAAPLDIYRVLRSINPSPYMYLLSVPDPRSQTGRLDIVGSSPETLVRVAEGRARTFPIAGSRPRGVSEEEDQRLAVELLEDPKERAEHIMLVDLSRNDLSKVCLPGSVQVREFMAIQRYSHIMHITSAVTGTLRPGVGPLDVLIGAFPAGTLSGAPKVRALELIDEIEPTRRGIYGGVVGYLDLAGAMDMAIAIRTAVVQGGVASVQAGAGIVAESDPASEYAEATTKAAAAIGAVQLAERLGTRGS